MFRQSTGKKVAVQKIAKCQKNSKRNENRRFGTGQKRQKVKSTKKEAGRRRRRPKTRHSFKQIYTQTAADQFRLLRP
jgi:hypothetical protein